MRNLPNDGRPNSAMTQSPARRTTTASCRSISEGHRVHERREPKHQTPRFQHFRSLVNLFISASKTGGSLRADRYRLPCNETKLFSPAATAPQCSARRGGEQLHQNGLLRPFSVGYRSPLPTLQRGSSRWPRAEPEARGHAQSLLRLLCAWPLASGSALGQRLDHRCRVSRGCDNLR